MPDFWSLYCENKSLFGVDEQAALRMFRARLNLAYRFRNMQIQQTSLGVSEGYFVLTKLGLTYAAYEALVALDSSIAVTIHDEAMKLALSGGAFQALVEHLRAWEERSVNPKRPKPKRFQLEEFGAGQANKDLLIFVKHCRNVIFHGSATPTSIGLATSRRRRELLLGLCNSVTMALEVAAKNWVQKRVKERDA